MARAKEVEGGAFGGAGGAGGGGGVGGIPEVPHFVIILMADMVGIKRVSGNLVTRGLKKSWIK